MLLSFRPLVSVSVVTLLSWVWYSFRKRSDSGLSEDPYLKPSEKSEINKSSKNIGTSDPKSVLGPTDAVLDVCRTPSTSPVNSQGVRPEPEGEPGFFHLVTLDAGFLSDSSTHLNIDMGDVEKVRPDGNQETGPDALQIQEAEPVLHKLADAVRTLEDEHLQINSRRPGLDSVTSSGEDSGCGLCLSVDPPGAEGQSSEVSEEGLDSFEVPSKSDMDYSNVQAKEACNGLDVKPPVNETSIAPPPAPPSILWDINVPAHLVGRLIGKQGKFVNFLKQNSGAKIYISTLPFTHEVQICHIQGSQQQVDEALTLIRKKFKDLDLSNCVPPQCLPMTSWLLPPQDAFVEVVVSRVEAAHYLFVQQHKHPSFQALSVLVQHMQLCYSQPGCPGLPTPLEAGVVCAAPVTGLGWQRAQVVQYHAESNMARIRYVDRGGYEDVNSAILRQIRSDFVALPFQAAEVLLDNITPLPGETDFPFVAKTALEEWTANVALILKVSGSHNGLPLVHLWKQTGDEVLLLNRLLADQGFCSWFDPR